jgi:hypothetical protein
MELNGNLFGPVFVPPIDNVMTRRKLRNSGTDMGPPDARINRA